MAHARAKATSDRNKGSGMKPLMRATAILPTSAGTLTARQPPAPDPAPADIAAACGTPTARWANGETFTAGRGQAQEIWLPQHPDHRQRRSATCSCGLESFLVPRPFTTFSRSGAGPSTGAQMSSFGFTRVSGRHKGRTAERVKFPRYPGDGGGAARGLGGDGSRNRDIRRTFIGGGAAYPRSPLSGSRWGACRVRPRHA